MSTTRSVAVLLSLCLAVPLVNAGSAPSIGFLEDGAAGPAGTGVISQAWPDSNESAARVVGPELLGLTVFEDADERPGTHLRGPVFAGVWPDAGLASDARLRVALWLDGEVIAEGQSIVNIDESKAPDPLTLAPDPADPEGSAYRAVAAVVPLILQPPTLVDMGFVDVEVPNGSSLQMSFSLIGADGGPAMGAGVALKYDGLLSPSFLYMPWWSADPQAEAPQVKAAREAAAPAAPPSMPASEPEPEPSAAPEEDSPGLAIVATSLLLVAVALLRRR